MFGCDVVNRLGGSQLLTSLNRQNEAAVKSVLKTLWAKAATKEVCRCIDLICDKITCSKYDAGAMCSEGPDQQLQDFKLGGRA